MFIVFTFPSRFYGSPSTHSPTVVPFITLTCCRFTQEDYKFMTQVIRTAGIMLGLFVLFVAPLRAQSTQVFINEIHYDNSGTDANEAIEIAGPAGTDLTGWTIFLYNGTSSVLDVYDERALSGTIPDLGGGFGVVVEFISGIQNGAPDGIVLYDGASVVQFLSYEGSFTAAGGVAARDDKCGYWCRRKQQYTG